MSAQARIDAAVGVITRFGTEMNFPKPSQFDSEAAADADVGPKLTELQDKFVAHEQAAGRQGYDLWDVAAPVYLRSIGWRVSGDGGGFTVETGDCNKK